MNASYPVDKFYPINNAITSIILRVDLARKPRYSFSPSELRQDKMLLLNRVLSNYVIQFRTTDSRFRKSVVIIFYSFDCRTRLLDVRGRLYELLTHCIPADVIIKVNVFFGLLSVFQCSCKVTFLKKFMVFLKGLLQELVTNCDGTLKAEVSHMAAFYEHRLQRGSKVIYHLEAFVAKFMSIYKRFLEEGMADFF